MYWLVDIVFVLLLVLTVVCSIKAGITGIFNGLVFGFIIKIVLFAAFTAGFLLLFEYTGAIDALGVFFGRITGASSYYDTNYVSEVMAILVFTLISLLLGILLMFLVCKLFAKIFANCKGKGDVNIVNKIVGGIVGTCLYVGVIACVFGCIHAFADAGSMQAADEVMRANIVSGFLYKINPLNALFNDLNFAPYVIDLFHGKF